MLPVVIAIFFVIAVLFGVCLFVFVRSYKSYSSEDDELYDDIPEEKPRGKRPASEASEKVKAKGTGPETKSKAGAKSAPKTGAAPEPKTGAKPATKAEAKPVPKAETKPEPKAETKPDSNGFSKPAGDELGGFDTRVATKDEMRMLRSAAAEKSAAGDSAGHTAAADSGAKTSVPAAKTASAPAKITAAGPSAETTAKKTDGAGEKNSKLVPIVTAVAASVAIICIAALAFVLISSRTPSDDEGDDRPETIALSYEDVEDVREDEYKITSPATLTAVFAADSKITDVKVEEGDFVKKGDAIYELDGTSCQEMIDLLEERLESIDLSGAAKNVNVSAGASGVVTDVRVSVGSTVTSGMVIAEITGSARHSLSVTVGSPLSVGDDISVTSGGVTAHGTVTTVRPVSPAPSDEEDGDGGEDGDETGDGGESGDDGDGGEDEEETAWAAVISFSSAGNVGATGTVTVDGKSYTGQVTRGRGSVSNVTATASGTVADLDIRPGDTVDAGDTVAEIETPASAQYADNEFEAKETQIQLDEYRQKLENYTVKAVADGYVQELFHKKGETVARDMKAVTIVPQDSLALEVKLDAETAENMTLPAPVSFKVKKTSDFPEDVWENLSPDDKFNYTIDSLAPADDDSGVYVGYVALTDDDQSLFRSGMTVDASVVVYYRYNALVIPENLVKKGKVKVMDENGEIKEVAVETGVRNKTGGIEIRDGIERTYRLVTD